MRPLQEQIGSGFRTVSIDWPSFGDLARPKVAWQPDAYRTFVSYIAADSNRPQTSRPATLPICGRSVSQRCGSLGPLILVSPTLRGPLPTIHDIGLRLHRNGAGEMGFEVLVGGGGWKRLPLFRWISRTIDLLLIGHVLYRLNVNRPMIRMMARGRVYAHRSWLTPERFKEKLAVTETPGARHASFRFAAGELDPFHERGEFLDTAKCIGTPAQVIFPAQAPRKSKAEMIALAALSNIKTSEVPLGKLSVLKSTQRLLR